MIPYKNLFIISVLNFLVRYRRTVLGPIWLLAGPSLFIMALGALYSQIGAHDITIFIPHLAVGLVYWTLISGFITSAPSIFVNNKQYIMQGNMDILDVVIYSSFENVIIFFHQLIIVAFVIFIFEVQITNIIIYSLLGLFIGIINGLWINIVFGIIGSRYRDVKEIFSAIMRIAFLATPIIWMPGLGERSQLLSVYVKWNPFYHFIEIFRAPLIGNDIESFTWFFVGTVTLFGSIAGIIMYKRYARLIPLWI